MSQRVERIGQFNLPLLAEEIEAAAPELFVDDVALFTLSYDGTTLVGIFPDTFSLSKLAGIAAAHNPNGESINQEKTRRREELRAGIKTKFLGLGFTLEELQFIKEVLG